MPTIQSYYAPTTRKVYDTTLTVAQSSLTIPIPGGGKNLRLYVQGRGDTSATGVSLLMRPNADATASNYNTQFMQGNATVLTAGEQIGSGAGAQVGTICAANSPASQVGHIEIFVPNYLMTAFSHPWSARSIYITSLVSAGLVLQHFAGYWLQGVVITQVVLLASAGNLAIGSAVQAYVDY